MRSVPIPVLFCPVRLTVPVHSTLESQMCLLWSAF